MEQRRFIIHFYSFFLIICNSADAQIRTIDIHGNSINQRFSNSKPNVKKDTIEVKTNEKSNPDQDSKMNKNEYYFFGGRSEKPKFCAPLRNMKSTSKFGYRRHPVMGGVRFHSGIDLKAYYEPVYTVADGVVEKCGHDDISGNYIVINHGKIKTVYCHLTSSLCQAGESVVGGSEIGISGNTGRSTGPHLHFGVKYLTKNVNPEILYFIKKSGF